MSVLHSYREPYANLAAAILDLGKRDNDKHFLESDWAETLREICRLDDERGFKLRNEATRSQGVVDFE